MPLSYLSRNSLIMQYFFNLVNGEFWSSSNNLRVSRTTNWHPKETKQNIDDTASDRLGISEIRFSGSTQNSLKNGFKIIYLNKAFLHYLQNVLGKYLWILQLVIKLPASKESISKIRVIFKLDTRCVTNRRSNNNGDVQTYNKHLAMTLRWILGPVHVDPSNFWDDIPQIPLQGWVIC